MILNIELLFLILYEFFHTIVCGPKTRMFLVIVLGDEHLLLNVYHMQMIIKLISKNIV